MAKLPALVTALSKCDERERTTLDHYARVIREAGLIPTTKRGSGAAEMTFREAANLLIAANTADTPKAAPLIVPQYRALIGQNYSATDEFHGVFGEVNEAKNFGDALEALIAGMPEVIVTFTRFLFDAYGRPGRDMASVAQGMLNFGEFINVEVSFFRPFPYAEIRIVAPGMETPVQGEWKFHADANLIDQGLYRHPTGDRRTRITVGLKTLRMLWAAVSGNDDSAAEPVDEA